MQYFHRVAIRQKKYGEPPKVFWKYYDLYRRKQITLNDYVVKTGLELPAICYYLDAVAEKKTKKY